MEIPLPSELTSDIPFHFEPKQSWAQFFYVFFSLAEPAQLELFGSRNHELRPACYTRTWATTSKIGKNWFDLVQMGQHGTTLSNISQYGSKWEEMLKKDKYGFYPVQLENCVYCTVYSALCSV